MKRVAILQSNYIPWKGYFDLINKVDEFILFDSVQYTKRDWRNRNQILSPQGLHWLTIPVESKGQYEQKICEVQVCNASWVDKHWATLHHCYRKAPFFDETSSALSVAYEKCRNMAFLSQLNYVFLKGICDLLDIQTKFSWSMDYSLVEGKSERLLHLCEQAGATSYLSGPAARAYLDEDLFHRNGIQVEWMSYKNYPEYSQLHTESFIHTVSIVDLLFNVGIHKAKDFISPISMI